MVKGSLIKELKDKKGNVCSRDYSYVSMTKKSSEDYEMTVYLSCAGEAQTATYNITYPSDNNDDQKDNKTTYYELQRIVTNDETYSCPDGYILKGTYCEKATETIAATPVYKVTPEKNTKASYKSSRSEYEYTDPIITIKENVLKCSNGYTLENGKCIKETSVKYKLVILIVVQMEVLQVIIDVCLQPIRITKIPKPIVQKEDLLMKTNVM